MRERRVPGPRLVRARGTALVRASIGAWIALAGMFAFSLTARAEWMEPDPALREAQMLLRMAARDTTGHANEPGKLDSLGAQLLRLARLDEAKAVYSRSLALNASNTEALAALGKIALFRDRLGAAESLLVAAGAEPGAMEDLLAARIRREEYTQAADLAMDLQQEGRAELLRAMAEAPVYSLVSGPDMARILWVSSFPTPLVRVKINGFSTLMAIDTGAGDLMIDPWVMRRAKVTKLPAQRTEFWVGTRVAVSNAMVQRFEIGGMKLERVPAGIVSLHKWSIEVNRYGEPVGGVIGINLLRRFTPTLDFKSHVLELRKPGTAFTPPVGTPRVPFELWGVNELTVYGSIGGARRMAMVVQSGVPWCGVGAPASVFNEIGVKPGMMARIAKTTGQWLEGRAWTAVMVPTIAFGPVVQDKVQGWSGALDEAELWRQGVRRDALIAGDCFRDWRMTIDWKSHQLIVEN